MFALGFFMPMKIQSITLWSFYARLLHGALALAMLFLAFSGWLMGQITNDVEFWQEWHQIAGQVTVFLLLARIWLFFQPGNSHFSRYKISANDLQTILKTLKFYASLARSELPPWFAINPVWRVLYALFYVLLVLLVISGLVDGQTLWLGIYWPSVHQSIASFMLVWLIVHLIATVLHDSKSKVGRISAMLSGVAYFESNSGVKPNEQQSVIETSFKLKK